MKVILNGFKHCEGTYEGRAYNSYRVYVTDCELSINEDTVGHEVMIVKVTPKVMNAFLQSKNDSDILDKKIELTFGMNNVVQKIELIK